MVIGGELLVLCNFLSETGFSSVIEMQAWARAARGYLAGFPHWELVLDQNLTISAELRLFE